MSTEVTFKGLEYSIKRRWFLFQKSSLYHKTIAGMPLVSILALFLIALLYSLPSFGSPTTFSDQEFYLWGGGQILNGKIPYIDFWDRKQVGLFLLFSLFYLCGDYRFIAVSIASILFATAGGIAVMKTALLITKNETDSKLKSFYAATVFLLGLVATQAENGQAEGFYVPTMCCAVSLLFSYWDRIQKSSSCLIIVGCGLMLLTGISLEIKASCLFLGILIGLALLMAILRNHGFTPLRKLFYASGYGFIWICIAVLPTVLVIYWYYQHGWLAEWYFANIVSAGLRHPFLVFHEARVKLISTIIICTAGMILTLPLISNRRLRTEFPLTWFIIIWWWVDAVFALYISLGDEKHYYTTILAPTIFLVILRKIKRTHLTDVVVCILTCVFLFQIISEICNRGSRLIFDGEYHFYKRAAYLMQQQPGCISQFTSTVLIMDTNKYAQTCIITKLSFPDHLSVGWEKDALPLNQTEERRRVLLEKPLYVLSKDDPNPSTCLEDFHCRFNYKHRRWDRKFNPTQVSARQEIDQFLHHYYVPILAEYKQGMRGMTLYKLKPGAIPKITPRGISPIPSSPVIYPIGWERRFSLRFCLYGV